jgi:hypothetical protein
MLSFDDINIRVGDSVEFDEVPCDDDGLPLVSVRCGTVEMIDFQKNLVHVSARMKDGSLNNVLFELDGQSWDVDENGDRRRGQGFKKDVSFIS